MTLDSDRTAATAETVGNAASPALTQMETLLVRSETDRRLVGWGEAFGHLANPTTIEALRTLVIPFFLNNAVPSGQAALATLITAAEKTLHTFGRGGPLRFALSAIAIALWDLLGQQRGQPLWQRPGARRRQINLYASLVSYNNRPEGVARQIKRAWQAGFHTLKLHETAYAAITAARAALPEQAMLMVDVSCSWTVDEARQRASWPAYWRWPESCCWPCLFVSKALTGCARWPDPASLIFRSGASADRLSPTP